MQSAPGTISPPRQTEVGREKGPTRQPYPDPVDDALDDSFPASDPPPWTLGRSGALERPEFRALSRQECEVILSRSHVGRIAYARERNIAILPVHYVYADGWIYGRMRRARKQAISGWYGWWPVAFQVDEVEDLFHWKTVHVHGGFYALPADGTKSDQEMRRHGINLLRRLIPRALRAGDPMKDRKGVFRIAVQEITGTEARPRVD